MVIWIKLFSWDTIFCKKTVLTSNGPRFSPSMASLLGVVYINPVWVSIRIEARFQFVFTCKIGFEDLRHAGNCGNFKFKDGEHEENTHALFGFSSRTFHCRMKFAPWLHDSGWTTHSGSGFRSGIKKRNEFNPGWVVTHSEWPNHVNKI